MTDVPPAPNRGNGAAKVEVKAVRGRAGWGVRVGLDGWLCEQTRPIGIEAVGARSRTLASGYSQIITTDRGFDGHALVILAPRVQLRVRDRWVTEQDRVKVVRSIDVEGEACSLAFLSWIRLRIARGLNWTHAEPFSPGLAYGDVEQVPRWSIASPWARRLGIRSIVVREDRMAVPIFAVRLANGRWVGVLDPRPDAETIAADGEDVQGETLIDPRLRTRSLGGVATRDGLELGAWLPATEGEVTYESGGLPLRQRRGWRRRYLPVEPGLSTTLEAAFVAGNSASRVGFWNAAWRRTWDALSPNVVPLAAGPVVADAVTVLAGQVRTAHGRTGIPLEIDPRNGMPIGISRPAIMGFVGANTDAAELLLRFASEAVAHGLEPGRTAQLGVAILDAFARVPLNPPIAEGFDLASGRLTTYRRLGGRRVVFLRSIAEGCHAALRAATLPSAPSVPSGSRATWRTWGLDGAFWISGAQAQDGSLPRAWGAGTGRVLQSSTSATAIAIPFLLEAAAVSRDDRLATAAVRAGEFAWARAGGEDGAFAGATLDNADVVDKEAAVLALEAFLALHRATGDSAWLGRAIVAAQVAETWIYGWNIPIPADSSADVGWKRGVPTIGLQLIATGNSMTDGFLASNAAAFARIGELAGDPHWLDVARIVTWGPKGMLAIDGRAYDLAGPGWAQEHWSLATRRGHGLNRAWLPWVAVSTLRGLQRVRDEVPGVALDILGEASEGWLKASAVHEVRQA